MVSITLALGVLDVNSIKINSGAQVVNGHGLYPLTSLLSHSCISNSSTVLKSDYSLDCKTTSFIRAGEDEIISYDNVLPFSGTHLDVSLD